MTEANRGNGGAQVETEGGTRLDGSPVEILRKLGVTKKGDPLETAYMDSWREQARLANERRPLPNKLLRRDKITADAIAQAELKGMVERATEVVTSQGVEATEGAIRQAMPQIASEFRPKTIPEIRVEAYAKKAEEQFNKALMKGKWGRAAKLVRKTQKHLFETPDQLKDFLTQASDAIQNRVADLVKEKDGATFLKALRTFDQALVDDYHIRVNNLPDITPEMLQEGEFLSGIDDVLSTHVRYGILSSYSGDRQVLSNAKVEEGMIDQLPNVRSTVLTALSDNLRYSGPEYFGDRVEEFREHGLKVDHVFSSQQVREVTESQLLDGLRYSGPEYFASKAEEFHKAGIDTKHVTESTEANGIVFRELVANLRYSAEYFGQRVQQFTQAGLDTAHVVVSNEVKAFTSENLLGRLRYGGAGLFDRGVKEFQEAGLSTESVSQSSEARAIVKEKLLGDLKFSSPEYFARKAQEFATAGLDTTHVINSREAQEIVTGKLLDDLRYSSPDHVVRRTQAFQEAGLDITPFLQSEETRKIVQEKIDSAVRYSSPESATRKREEYSALGFSYTPSNLTRDVRWTK